MPFDPPSVYRTWWSQTESCAGRHASYGSVRWFFVPGAIGWQTDDGYLLGSWVERGNKITLGELSISDSLVVRHEMLHSILQRGDHPIAYFLTKCGEVVAQPTTVAREMMPRFPDGT